MCIRDRFYERSSYAASKHALHGYFETLRLETEKQGIQISIVTPGFIATNISVNAVNGSGRPTGEMDNNCLLYTSDAADERSSVDLGGRRIIKKKKKKKERGGGLVQNKEENDESE